MHSRERMCWSQIASSATLMIALFCRFDQRFVLTSRRLTKYHFWTEIPPKHFLAFSYLSNLPFWRSGLSVDHTQRYHCLEGLPHSDESHVPSVSLRSVFRILFHHKSKREFMKANFRTLTFSFEGGHLCLMNLSSVVTTY